LFANFDRRSTSIATLWVDAIWTSSDGIEPADPMIDLRSAAGPISFTSGSEGSDDPPIAKGAGSITGKGPAADA
jgi:hypothetical protein